MSWPTGRQPFGVNHVPLLSGLDKNDGATEVPIAVDPSNGQVQVNTSGGGGGGTSSTFGATFPTIGTAAGASDGTNMQPLLVDGSGYLEVNVKAGSGSGLSVTDEATWTAGTSNFVPGGGAFNDSATALTSGQQGTQRLTPNRAQHVNIRNQSGTELATSSNPLQVSLANTGSNSTAVTVGQGTAANLNATVVGAGTAGSPSGGVVSIQGVGSGTVVPVSGTVTVNTITGFATSANQTNKSQITQIADGSGNIIASTSNALNVSANITGGSIANTSFGTTSAAVNVGQKAVNTSAVQISATSTVPTNGILIGALSTNSASIFVGGSGVTTSAGVELVPGASMPFTANLNTLYIISVASTTDKVWYNVT